MAEDLQLRVESKLLELSLDDLRDVAVKLGIVDLPEELSKIAVMRRIRAVIEESMGEDEGANIELLESVMKSIVGDPPPLEDSFMEEPNSEEDMDRSKTELEKERMMVEQVRAEYEAMEKLLKEKEAQFKKAQDSLEQMSINIPQKQPQPSQNRDKPVDQSLQALGSILRVKDFKIIGNISNDKGHISLSNLNKQIESGLAKGYSERDVVDGVIQAISPSLHLKSYLESKKCLSLEELRKIRQSHYCEKTPTEAYQELSSIVQEKNESALNFLMRCLKLREQIIVSSQEQNAAIKFDENHVQSVFIHSVETGLIDDTIRNRMRPFLQNKGVPDETLIREINLAMSIENERVNKFTSANKKVPKVQAVTVSPAPVEKPEKVQPQQAKQAKQDRILTALNELKADVDALKKSAQSPAREVSQPKTRKPKHKCKSCEENETEKCDHCFHCGADDHFSYGCRKRRTQGNGPRLHQGGKM
eukprot:gene5109-5757_t